MFACSLILHIMVSGCGRQERRPGIYIQEDDVLSLAEMKPEDVIVRVNGRSISKRDYTAYDALQRRLFVMKGGESGDVGRYVAANEQAFLLDLFNRELLRQAAESAGVTVSASNRVLREKRVLEVVKRPNSTLAKVAEELGADAGRMFLSMFEGDALTEALCHHDASNGVIRVAEKEIDAYLKHIRTYNRRVRDSNRRSLRRARRARKEILDGGNFAAVTERCADLAKGDGKKWITAQTEDFPEGSGLRTWLEKAKVGDISGPVQLEDGIAIVGLLSKYQGEFPGIKKDVWIHKLVRCTFTAWDYSPVPSRAEARKTLEGMSMGKLQMAALQRSMDAAVVEYPHGTNLFPVVEAETSEAGGRDFTNAVKRAEELLNTQKGGQSK